MLIGVRKKQHEETHTVEMNKRSVVVAELEERRVVLMVMSRSGSDSILNCRSSDCSTALYQ